MEVKVLSGLDYFGRILVEVGEGDLKHGWTKAFYKVSNTKKDGNFIKIKGAKYPVEIMKGKWGSDGGSTIWINE